MIVLYPVFAKERAMDFIKLEEPAKPCAIKIRFLFFLSFSGSKMVIGVWFITLFLINISLSNLDKLKILKIINDQKNNNKKNFKFCGIINGKLGVYRELFYKNNNKLK